MFLRCIGNVFFFNFLEKYFQLNPNLPDGNEKYLKILLVSLACTPLIVFSAIASIIQAEFHVEKEIKGLLTYLAQQAGNEDWYVLELILVCWISTLWFTLDVWFAYHLLLIPVLLRYTIAVLDRIK